MDKYKKENIIAPLALLITLMITVSTPHAREFRDIHIISAPALPGEEASQPTQVFQPVDRKVVDEVVRKVFAQYNTLELGENLANEFYDKERLLDAVSEQVPRDAQVRVLSVQGVETFDQEIQPDPSGGLDWLVSVVSVTVRAQMEFNDPTGGFQRREGTNELILRISQPMIP